MLTVPLLMLLAFIVLSGGGVTGSLKTLERTLWRAVDWLVQLLA